eukprot:GFYU01000796.1.p1 GENE.GFYU01000796.1~~GFYU01000796.1.p1  ORF type:complete len:187 (+),score=34.38 GFYU01000796.1:46-561(+)
MPFPAKHCRFDRDCRRPDCFFFHPNGRVLDEMSGFSNPHMMGGGMPNTSAMPVPASQNSAEQAQMESDMGQGLYNKENEWFPPAKDCDCCKGYIYGCKGSECLQIKHCTCTNPTCNEDDPGRIDEWFPAARDCDCCKGFIYGCKASTCVSLGCCGCMYERDPHAQLPQTTA